MGAGKGEGRGCRPAPLHHKEVTYVQVAPAAESSTIPDGWWNHYCVQEAARRCDPYVDLVGFFEELAIVIEDYLPKVHGWLEAHGFTAGEAVDLMAECRMHEDPADVRTASRGSPSDVWQGGLRQLYLHGVDADTMALMLGIDREAVDEYIANTHMSESLPRVRELHAQGLNNTQIGRELDISERAVARAITDLGLVGNGSIKRITEKQKVQIQELRKRGTSYTDICRIVDVNLDQVKNTLRRSRRKQSA